VGFLAPRPLFWWTDAPATDLAAELERSCPGSGAAVIDDAERILAAGVRLFRDWVTVGSPPDWHRDPLGGEPWPRLFAGDIDLRATGHGSVRRVWELNRHHEFLALGQAYALTGDERYAAKLCALWGDWLVSNPVDVGVNWASGLEMAIRIMNWAWAWALLERRGRLAEALARDVLHAVAKQSRWIDEHPSLYSTANNHRIGEAAALAAVGMLWPGLPQAERWRRQGLETLSAEVSRQISPDGILLEQAFHYQAFVLDACMWVLDLARRAEVTPATELAERVRAAAGFLRTVMDTRGELPAVGDSDEGWFLRFVGVAEPRYRGLLQVATAAFGDAALDPIGDAPDPQLFWRLGPAGVAARAGLRHARTEPASRAFAIGGYAVFRGGGGTEERVGVLDCGPLGMGTLAAHGHADALAFNVSLGGRPALVDAGTYGYHEQPEWRPYFRGTSAHNTVRVDGKDQSEIGGPFLWTRHARAHLDRWVSSPVLDLARASHNGYRAVGVRHQRTVIYRKPDTWILLDTLLGTGEHRIEQRFHLATGTVEVGADRLRASGAGLTLVGAPLPGLRLTAWRGSEEPREGWHSHRFGHREPCTALVYGWHGALPVTLVTVVSAGEAPNVVELVQASDGGAGLRLEYGGFTDYVAVSGAGPTAFEVAGLRGTGELAWLRLDAARHPCWLGGLHLRRLEWQGSCLHDGLTSVVDRVAWDFGEAAGRPAPVEGELACH
jgi:hypothetical protein